jgi:hypothetical protein
MLNIFGLPEPIYSVCVWTSGDQLQDFRNVVFSYGHIGNYRTAEIPLDPQRGCTGFDTDVLRGYKAAGCPRSFPLDAGLL